MKRRVWTLRRQLLGNLLPGLCAAPFALAGIWLMWSQGNLLGKGLILFVASLPVGIVSLNWLGLFENRTMRTEFDAVNGSRIPKDKERYFVGFARPTYSSLLDPHEDVGYLILSPDAVEFLGEHVNIRLQKTQVTGVRFRMNPHALIGLGRWVSLEGSADGRPFRLLVEPREAKTLIGNRRIGTRLFGRLREWRTDGRRPPASA